MDIFPSFTSRDQDLTWTFIDGLRRAGATVWDYTGRGEGITAGSVLADDLVDRIQAAEVFLVFITEASLANEWTQFEVSCACRRMKEGPGVLRVIPLAEVASSSFVGPYKDLASMFFLEVARGDRAQNESSLRRLCAELGLQYVPSHLSQSSVYAKRFIAELTARAGEKELTVAQRLELFDTIAYFNEQLDLEPPDWSGMLESVMAFQYRTRREGLGSWYYPLVVKGWVQLELADVMGAEKSLVAAAKHPAADEHALSLLGLACYRQGRTGEAIHHIKEAMHRCSSQVWELKINMLTVLHHAGQVVDVEEALHGVDLHQLPTDDWLKVMNLRGASFYRRGCYSEALKTFEEVWTRTDLGKPVADDLTALSLAETLKALDRPDKACTVLETAAQRFRRDNLYHHLATLLYELNRVSESFRAFEILQEPQFRRRLYGVGYARRLYFSGKRKRMEEVCRDVTSDTLFGVPRTPEDFWHCGFAQFLLGNRTLSEYDRKRGAAYSTQRYDDLMAVSG